MEDLVVRDRKGLADQSEAILVLPQVIASVFVDSYFGKFFKPKRYKKLLVRTYMTSKRALATSLFPDTSVEEHKHLRKCQRSSDDGTYH